jgi:hypothetical protein
MVYRFLTYLMLLNLLLLAGCMGVSGQNKVSSSNKNKSSAGPSPTPAPTGSRLLQCNGSFPVYSASNSGKITFTQLKIGDVWLPSSKAWSFNATGSGECEFSCIAGYHYAAGMCELDTKRTAICTGTPPSHAAWHTDNLFGQTWISGGFSPTSKTASFTLAIEDCGFKCNSNYHWESSVCTDDTRGCCLRHTPN